MDASGYQTRFSPPRERNVGGTHGLYLIFFLLEHTTTVVPLLALFLAFLFSNFVAALTPLQFLSFALFVPVAALATLAVTLVVLSRMEDGPELVDGANWEDFIKTTAGNETALDAYKGKKIPMGEFVQLYLNNRVDFKGDPVRIFFEQRHRIFRFALSTSHLNFFLGKFAGQLIHHSKKADTAEVRDVYDRGNDFYAGFLGKRMVYTSGIFESDKDTLEEAQDRKLDIVCRKMHLEPGMELLDIGCGWGTLLCHAAKHYGVKATGVTLAREQREWLVKVNAPEYGVKVGEEVEMLCCDYRDIPKDKVYDRVSCLEMAEHVGIKNFQNFLLQVKSMLKDDGIFYLQIAGLRRAWQFEDLVWGLFMGTYIFPGADASCPLGFVTTQCERAGFEIHSVENCGVHYAMTINAWTNNWMANRKEIEKKYGGWYWRLFLIFLAWSTVIATAGCSTVFLITMHKNTSRFDRKGMWVGPYPVAVQQ